MVLNWLGTGFRADELTVISYAETILELVLAGDALLSTGDKRAGDHVISSGEKL